MVNITMRSGTVIRPGNNSKQGPKGDPGGNTMAIGLLIDLGGITVPVGTNTVIVDGHSVLGEGSARWVRRNSEPSHGAKKQDQTNIWFELAEDEISPEMVGCVDGTLCPDELQIALDYIAAKGAKLRSKGNRTYITDTQLHLTGKSGFDIDLRSSTIKADDGMTVGSGTQVILLTSCSDFSVKRVKLDGNRDNRTPSETTSHLFECLDCHDFELRRVVAQNGTTDGFYFGATDYTDADTFCSDFRLDDCKASNNYRNGLTVADGCDGVIDGYCGEDSNGTAPQAGIDIEATSGAANPSNRSIRIRSPKITGCNGYAIQISATENPTGIVIEDPYISDCDGGGIINGGAGTIVRGGRIENLSASGAVGVKNSSTANATIDLYSVTFKNFTSTAKIYEDGSSSGRVRFFGGKGLSVAGGIGIAAANCLIDGFYLDTCSGIGISIATTADAARIINTVINAATGRAVYCDGTNVLIDGLVAKDVGSVSGAYVQLDTNAAGGMIMRSRAEASTSQATTIGFRFPSTARAVMHNKCVNLHTTDPYQAVGGFLGVAFGLNEGGTANSVTAWRVPMAMPNYSDGSRPAASSLVKGAAIWNTSDNAPNYSDTSNWRDAAGATT
jgi:hypothetical protein